MYECCPRAQPWANTTGMPSPTTPYCAGRSCTQVRFQTTGPRAGPSATVSGSGPTKGSSGVAGALPAGVPRGAPRGLDGRLRGAPSSVARPFGGAVGGGGQAVADASSSRARRSISFRPPQIPWGSRIVSA